MNRRNVGQKPKRDFNAHDDFFNLMVTTHILAAAMEILGMETTDDNPSEDLFPPDIDALPKTERKELLEHTVTVIVNSYVDIKSSVSNVSDKEAVECGNRESNDKVQHYAKGVLTLGLIYTEFSDAIREGDGEQVLQCWKFLMLIFKAT